MPWTHQEQTCCSTPLKFSVLELTDKVTTNSKPRLTDFDLSNQEIHLKQINITLSHQDWVLGPCHIQASKQMQSLHAEDFSAQNITVSPLHVQEFVWLASRLGHARIQVSHPTFNRMLRHRVVYLADMHRSLECSVLSSPS